MSAGYSGTPLVRKIGVREGHHLTLVGAPVGWAIEGLPKEVRISQDRTETGADVVIAFFSDFATLQRELPSLVHTIVSDGAIWVAWPRRAGGHRSDITDNGIRTVVLPIGLVDVKVAALDDDWSGLKMVWRKERRPKLLD